MRRFDDIPWEEDRGDWKSYAALNATLGAGIVNDASIFHDVVMLNFGMPDLMAMQACQEWWFLKTEEYRFDATVLMAKLIINMHWAKKLGDSRLISANSYQFPIINMALCDGPYYPSEHATFGPDDEHFVVWEEQQLWLVPFGKRQITHRIPVEVVHQ